LDSDSSYRLVGYQKWRSEGIFEGRGSGAQPLFGTRVSACGISRVMKELEVHGSVENKKYTIGFQEIYIPPIQIGYQKRCAEAERRCGRWEGFFVRVAVVIAIILLFCLDGEPWSKVDFVATFWWFAQANAMHAGVQVSTL
jgi:hypothetical protein